MEGVQGQGWQTLSGISTFMQHVDRRKQLKVFGQLDARLDYCEYLIRRESNKSDIKRFKSKKRKKQLNQDLRNALESLSLDQLIQHFNKLVQQLVDLTHNIYCPPPIDATTFIICQAYSQTYSLKMWKKKKLRFDRENHIIYAEKDKKIKIYDLGNYLVRRTEKSGYFGLALEAVNDVPLERSKKAHFGFQYKNTYNLWFNSIQRSVEYKQWEAIVVSLDKEQLIAKKKSEESAKAKENQWDRLNKTEGHHTTNEEDRMEVVQSTIYIPPPPKSENDDSFTSNPMVKSDSQLSPKSQEILTASFKADPEIDFKAIIQQSYAYRLTHHSNAFASLQDLQFQLQVEDDTVKKSKLQLSFANALLDELDINTNELENTNNFDRMELTGLPLQKQQIHLYQSKQKLNNFKLIFLTLPQQNVQAKTIVQHFLNLDHYKDINKAISFCSTKAALFSQNSTLIYEQHHPCNRLYRSRQFYYVRHLTRNIHSEYFIIDRSINRDSLPLPDNTLCVRGELQTVYRFSREKGRIKVVADITLNHGGGLAQTQNITLCKKYIKDLACGLGQYFSGSLKQEAKAKYYNFESHSKHPPNVQQSSIHKQMTLSQEMKPLIDNPPKNKPSRSKLKPFYRIPRSQIIQNTSLTESFYTDQDSQHLHRLRRTVSPNRKTYIQNRSSKAPPERTTKEEGEWQVLVESQWKEDWIVDEGMGGVIVKRNPTLREKEVMKKIIQTAVKKSLLGKDIENISFPVDILAPESELQRLLGHLCCAPALLTGTAHLPILQKLLKTVVFGLQVSLLSFHNQRAFDATLGETYQCRISNDCDGYAQQVSVVPSISAIYVVGRDFTISAMLRNRSKMMMNSVSWQNEGNYRVNLAGEEVCFTTPPVLMNGTTYNQRQFLLQERSFYWVEDKNIVLQLQFEPKNAFCQAEDAKKDYFWGTVYQVSPQFMQSFLSCRENPPEGCISRVLGKISGRWTKYLTFEDQTIQISQVPLSQIYSSSRPLPSDSSHRQDVSHLREGNLQQAQSMKEAVEQGQRREAILRHDFCPS